MLTCIGVVWEKFFILSNVELRQKAVSKLLVDILARIISFTVSTACIWVPYGLG